jgi:hypothetical protein
LADLPDPSGLDDEALDLWQLATLAIRVRDEIFENDDANIRYYE